MLKALPNLLPTIVNRFSVEREAWNHTEKQKKGHIFQSDQQAYYLQVLQDFTNHWKKSVRVATLIETTYETL